MGNEILPRELDFGRTRTKGAMLTLSQVSSLLRCSHMSRKLGAGKLSGAGRRVGGGAEGNERLVASFLVWSKFKVYKREERESEVFALSSSALLGKRVKTDLRPKPICE